MHACLYAYMHPNVPLCCMCDLHVLYVDSEGPCPSHMIVMCRGRVFTFDALCDGRVLTPPELLR